jgi:hypothetical protein
MLGIIMRKARSFHEDQDIELAFFLVPPLSLYRLFISNRQPLKKRERRPFLFDPEGP